LPPTGATDWCAHDEATLLGRVFATLDGYYELGSEVTHEPLVRFVRNQAAPRIYDANHASSVRAASDKEIGTVLARADEVFAGLAHRQVRCDAWTPPAFEARLVLDDYERETELQLLLGGDLRLPSVPPGIEIRLVADDNDWESLQRLTRLDQRSAGAQSGLRK
jgi:hypothetical protein